MIILKNDSKYRQPMKGWTENMCNFLSENRNDVECLIEELASKSYITLKKSGTRARVSSEKLRENKKLYEKTLTIIGNYYNDYNKNSELMLMGTRDKFLLHYFWSRLSAHLNNFDDAFKHDQEVIKILEEANLNNANEEWMKKYNTKPILMLLNNRMSKHRLIAEGPLSIEALSSEEGPRKPEEILTSKTYLAKGTKKLLSAEEMLKHYEAFRKTKFSTLILKMTALNAVEHDTFGIFFADSIRHGFGKGFYTWGSKVHIREIPKNESSTCFHELTHMAMDRLFGNDCCPYPKDNVKAQNAYRESMRQVILNLVEGIIPMHELEKLECNKNYILQLSSDSSARQPHIINFPHPWSKSLSIEQLIENCYGTHGVLNDSLDVMHTRLAIDGREIQKIDCFSLEPIGSRLETLFESSEVYDIASYDREFITFMTENLVGDPSYQDSKLYKPFKDYLEMYVNPEMEEFIAKHRSKSKVIVEDSSYKNLLINSASILLNNARTSIIFIFIFILALIYILNE